MVTITTQSLLTYVLDEDLTIRRNEMQDAGNTKRNTANSYYYTSNKSYGMDCLSCVHPVGSKSMEVNPDIV